MSITPSLKNPFASLSDVAETDTELTSYERAVQNGVDLRRRPLEAGGDRGSRRQHSKGRMTVWERIQLLADEKPMVLFQNWGPNLDGASLVTAVI